MARRKHHDARLTREAVLDSAERCFRLQGGAHASVESIAARAGWSRGAATYHFRGKAELLRAVLARGQLPLTRDLARIARTSGPVIPALRQCAHRWMHALQSEPHARNAFGILAWAYDYADDYAGIRRDMRVAAARGLRRLRGLMQRAAAAGELREGLGGRECARLLAAWWLGAASMAVSTPRGNEAAIRPCRPSAIETIFMLISGEARANQ